MKLLMILSVLLPVVVGISLPILKIKNKTVKYSYIILALLAELGLVIALILGESEAFTLFAMTDTLKVEMKIDEVSKLFMIIGSAGFLLSGIFALKYMEHEEHTIIGFDGFFTFFFLSLAALIGMDMSSNLISMYFFFEMVTLFSMPLVVVEGTKEAIAAGLKYLFYSIAGAFLALGCIFVMAKYANSFDFVAGGNLNMSLVEGSEKIIYFAVLAGVIGFGAKAGMFPLHGWLPTAHPVAPAPASAVLSGIITKAGVLAIFRVIYFVVGPDFIRGTWVQLALLTLALITVFMGSMMAYRENVFKKRLAFSSVSQISYVLFGLFLLTPAGLLGACMQILYHATVKICLFLTAGSIIANTHKHNVDEFAQMGKIMPVTMVCFTLASLSLIGIPPFAGFVSKWYLAQGSLSSGIAGYDVIGPIVLLISALLTAGYLLPITIKSFWPGHCDEVVVRNDEGGKLMLIPLIILAVLALLMGIFSGYLYPFFNGIMSMIF